MNSQTSENKIDFNMMLSLVQPNEDGAYILKAAGSVCKVTLVIPGYGPSRTETWKVEVGTRKIVTETDDFGHAMRQAIAYAEQIADGICGPHVNAGQQGEAE